MLYIFYGNNSVLKYVCTCVQILKLAYKQCTVLTNTNLGKTFHLLRIRIWVRLFTCSGSGSETDFSFVADPDLGQTFPLMRIRI